MTLQEIYNTVLAGKTIELDFPGKETAEYFRTRLARFKTRQEGYLTALGAIDAMDSPLALSFSFDHARKVATIKLRERAAVKQYTVRIIDDDSSTDGTKEKTT